ncbi:MAG: hypothetical protein HY652_05950 [Acidobacteria bacterium]|nr:hypothetical protein [Acidobacteriota bacterium]
MSYIVRYRGSVEIECATLEDAIAIAERLASGERVMPEHRVTRESSPPVLQLTRFKEFVGQLRDQQKRLLGAIAEQPHGKTDRVLRQMFDLSDNKALGGMFAGISKIGAKSGISTDALYTVSKIDVAGEEVKEYRPTESLRKAAKDIGWKVS